MNRRQLIVGGAATCLTLAADSLFRRKSSESKLPTGIELVDKRNKRAWGAIGAEFYATHGKIWDILGWGGNLPQDESRFQSNHFILSDVDEDTKGTVDLFNCFGIALVGTSSVTRRKISGVAHQNIDLLREFGDKEVFREKFLIPALRQSKRPITEEEMAKPEWENPKDLYERTLRAWIREFMDRTLEGDRRLVMGDGQYLEGDEEARQQYLSSAHYLKERIEEASGITPQLFAPKVPRKKLIDRNYRLQTTDLMILTQKDHIVFARPSYPENRDKLIEF